MAQFDNLIDELNDMAPELDDGGSGQEEDSGMEEEGQMEEEESGEEEGEESDEGEMDEGDSGESDEPEDDGGGDEEEDELGDVEAEPAPEGDPEPVVDPNAEALAELREQNRKLMEMLQQSQQPTNQEKVAEKPAAPKTLAELKGDLSFDEIMNDEELFMGFMQNVMAMASEQSVERVATTMPQYVMNQVRQQQSLTEATDNFYIDNVKLVPHRKVVGMLANEVVAEHQDWNLDQVFEETAKRSYTLLNMKKEAIAESSEKPGPKPKPALNKKTRSGKRAAPKLSKLQREINDLI